MNKPKIPKTCYLYIFLSLGRQLCFDTLGQYHTVDAFLINPNDLLNNIYDYLDDGHCIYLF